MILFVIFSIFEDIEVGARAEAMGRAYTALSNDASGVFFNPGGLSLALRNEVSFYYKNLWGGVEGLHTASFSSLLSTRLGTFGFGITETGFSLEREVVALIAFSKKIIKYLYPGYSFKLYYLSMERFGSDFSFGVDVGIVARGYKNFRLGVLIKNLIKPSFGKNFKYSLPFTLKAGLAYSGFPGLISSVDFSKEEGKDTKFSVGEEFEIIPQRFHILFGGSSSPLNLCFGLKVSSELFSFCYGNSYNSEIGFTHFVSISCLWGKRRYVPPFEIE